MDTYEYDEDAYDEYIYTRTLVRALGDPFFHKFVDHLAAAPTPGHCIYPLVMRIS